VRRRLTLRFVVAISLIILLLCAGWAVLVQRVVPDACSYSPPPPDAQYLHCP
jgi:hypothetical protein